MDNMTLADIAAVTNKDRDGFFGDGSGFFWIVVLFLVFGMMGGGFGGCTINLVKDELYDSFVNKAKTDYYAKFNKALKVYDIVISDGAHKICD